MARIQNSLSDKDIDILAPLHNWEDNAAIVSLPATVGISSQ